MENLSKYIGNQIKSLRERQGLTQDDLAERLNTTRQSISRYENGERKANQDILFELSDIFRVSINIFFPNSDSNEGHNISTIYNQLVQPRKEKVYSFAEFQLAKQTKVVNSEERTERITGIPSSCYISEDNIKHIPKNANYSITIEGDGLAPAFNDGDTVFIQESKIFEDGSIVAISFTGESGVKISFSRIKHDYDNQQIFLQSLNGNYDDLIYEEDKGIIIFGRVID